MKDQYRASTKVHPSFRAYTIVPVVSTDNEVVGGVSVCRVGGGGVGCVGELWVGLFCHLTCSEHRPEDAGVDQELELEQVWCQHFRVILAGAAAGAHDQDLVGGIQRID
jgi:hypothetical protein